MTTAADGDDRKPRVLQGMVPDGHLLPPSDTQFANATWLRCGPEVMREIEEVLGNPAYDEFNELAGMPFAAVWRRRSKPARRSPGDDKAEEPIYVTCATVDPLVIWHAGQVETPDFPTFFIFLHWQWFDDLRHGGKMPGEDDEQPAGARYVSTEVLRQHPHDGVHAPARLGVSQGEAVRAQQRTVAEAFGGCLIEQHVDQVELGWELQLGQRVLHPRQLVRRRHALVHETVDLRAHEIASGCSRACSLTLPSSLWSAAISLPFRPENASTTHSAWLAAISWNSLRPLGVSSTR